MKTLKKSFIILFVVLFTVGICSTGFADAKIDNKNLWEK